MNVIVTRRARDGRLYPATLTDAERRRARVLTHNLICRNQMSVRGAQRVMLEAYALRRSVGWIHHTLTSYACGHPRCPCVPIEPPELPRQPEPEPVRSVVHQGGGGLTGMVRDG